MNLSDLENELDPNVTRQEKLAAAKAAIAGSTPLIPDAPDCIVHLPRGLHQGGAWKKEAEVRELTGADEEALARTKEANDFFDLVLAHGVVKIEDVDLASLAIGQRQAALRELLVGERSQLLLAILAATYGNEKVLNVTCPHCDMEQEATLVLTKDFIPKTVEGLDQQTFTYTTSKGEEVTFRLVTGADQLEALKRKGATTAEQNTLILSRCITLVNGTFVVNPMGFARGMGMKDRTALLQAMVDKQPDIDLSVQMRCLGCGGEIILALGWGDLFRP
jgi:hypothetical protein